jgi:hypothetical protein
MPRVEAYYHPGSKEVLTHLKVGVIPGLNKDMFVEVIQPAMEARGYTIELHEYLHSADLNTELANGILDLNMFQTYYDLNNFRYNHNLELSAIMKVPTNFRYWSLVKGEFNVISIRTRDLTQPFVADIISIASCREFITAVLEGFDRYENIQIPPGLDDDNVILPLRDRKRGNP